MAGVDIQAEALAWALDEVGKQAFGEDFGVAVTWSVSAAMTPGGQPQMVPMWALMLTARNPLLGEGPLYHIIGLGDQQAINLHIRPLEAEVRQTVTEGLRLLRELAARKLAGGNGKPAALAGGSG